MEDSTLYLAHEAYQALVNGNITHVRTMLSKMPALEAAHIGAHLMRLSYTNQDFVDPKQVITLLDPHR